VYIRVYSWTKNSSPRLPQRSLCLCGCIDSGGHEGDAHDTWSAISRQRRDGKLRLQFGAIDDHGDVFRNPRFERVEAVELPLLADPVGEFAE